MAITEPDLHSHSHQMVGDWDEWMGNPVLRALLAMLLVAALVTLAARWRCGPTDRVWQRSRRRR